MHKERHAQEEEANRTRARKGIRKKYCRLFVPISRSSHTCSVPMLAESPRAVVWVSGAYVILVLFGYDTSEHFKIRPYRLTDTHYRHTTTWSHAKNDALCISNRFAQCRTLYRAYMCSNIAFLFTSINTTGVAVAVEFVCAGSPSPFLPRHTPIVCIHVPIYLMFVLCFFCANDILYIALCAHYIPHKKSECPSTFSVSYRIRFPWLSIQVDSF